MLDSFSRGTIVALSAMCVAGTFAFEPLRVRGSIAEPQPGAVPLPFAAPPRAIPIVAIRRDPFAEPTAAGATAQLSPSPVAAETLARSGSLDALPSNLASDTIPAIPGDATNPVSLLPGRLGASPPGAHRITAVVTGAHPYAMVETAGVHEIKGIGDRIDGIAIVAIDLNGIRLRNGALLAVDGTVHQ